jgi:hypothetical protein
VLYLIATRSFLPTPTGPSPSKILFPVHDTITEFVIEALWWQSSLILCGGQGSLFW